MTTAHSRPAEHGGAYLLALTALLVLTALGIALSRIGTTERRLGVAGASRLQALAAADSGLAILIAALLSGGELESRAIELGRRSAGTIDAASRVGISPPSLLSVTPCRACDGDAGGMAKVSYRLEATGERFVRTGAASAGRERRLAGLGVEAVVTLQPWPAPGWPEATAPAWDERCADEMVISRLVGRLTDELNPRGCRFAGRSFPVPAFDPESGALCAIPIRVCVLLSDWRELGPS